jgi:hypothetical protein
MELNKVFDILLTPDGKGKRKKAEILRELCDTANANLVREALQKLLADKKFV